ncbi:hypothetical protein H0Z60_08560 [Ectothiorhodospiraceae bacterium WFHF3C12]|nr:hypothetical protein [Ectothiorhodospiraceae bacterium WFHF3C12]
MIERIDRALAATKATMLIIRGGQIEGVADDVRDMLVQLQDELLQVRDVAEDLTAEVERLRQGEPKGAPTTD